MILVDANLLIYAVNADLPDHSQSKIWFEAQVSGTELVGPPWVAPRVSLESAQTAGSSKSRCQSNLRWITSINGSTNPVYE